MVDPTPPPLDAHITVRAGLCWVIDEDGYDGVDGPHFDSDQSASAVAEDWAAEDGETTLAVRGLTDPCWTVTCAGCGAPLESEDWPVTHYPTEAIARRDATTQACVNKCAAASPSGPPTIAEVLDLTRRLRRLSTPFADVDEHERAAFLADKHALISRIPATGGPVGTGGAA